jgi:hypothetical protein
MLTRPKTDVTGKKQFIVIPQIRYYKHQVLTVFAARFSKIVS